jgi:hypothetical protein
MLPKIDVPIYELDLPLSKKKVKLSQDRLKSYGIE